jgi:hypothetical protein
VHAVDPDTAEEPTGQAAQTLEPGTEKVLGAQVTHVDAPVDEKDPAAHIEQADVLAEAENEPAAHIEQADVLAEAENEPAAQMMGIVAVVMTPA